MMTLNYYIYVAIKTLIQGIWCLLLIFVGTRQAHAVKTLIYIKFLKSLL